MRSRAELKKLFKSSIEQIQRDIRSKGLSRESTKDTNGASQTTHQLNNHHNHKPLRFSFFEYFLTLLPGSFFSNTRTKIFHNGVEMINQKLDIGHIVHSLNELEKLKLLLFDENQYSLFQHIPKPILFDETLLKLKEQNKLTSKMSLHRKENKSKRASNVLTCNAQFWKRLSSDEKEKNFKEALKRIKEKEDPDIIDQRLIHILKGINYL